MTKSNTELATQNSGVSTTKEQPILPELAMKNFFTAENVKNKFKEILGQKTQGFVTSLLQVINGNKSLAKADPKTIYQAAMMAATLDLPINNNLGFAWIVPYGDQGQFQIGWKGLVQLAMRTGQYLRMNVVEVYGNQFKKFNSLTEELDADFEIDGEGDIVGYCAYFKLLNGFEKTVYWSKDKVTKHAKKYSKAFSGSGSTPWKDVDQFHEMAKKTVLKNTLSKWGILSIEMQRAVIADQAIIRDAETLDVDYVDHADLIRTDAANIEMNNLIEQINSATSKAELEALGTIPDQLLDLYNEKLNSL